MIKRHILLVEDDAQCVTLMKFMLEHAGFIVKIAKDGYEALDLVQTYSFDLIILDINLPHVNGFSFLERYKNIKELASVPVFVLTVRDDKKSVLRAKQLGADQYLVKPPAKEDLLRKIEVALGGRPQYRMVNLDPEAKEGVFTFQYFAQVISVSEAGFVMHSPIPFEVGSVLQNWSNPIFDSLGIHPAKLTVAECVKDGKSGKHVVFVTFSDIGENDVRLLRAWVVEKCLKEN